MRRELLAVALAGLLVLAGCSSAVAPGGSGSGASTDDATPSTPVVTSGQSGTGSGTVNFYVSDERNAIGDFEHLNVTVERVSFARVSDGGNDTRDGDDAAEAPESAETGADADNGTGTPEPASVESGADAETGEDDEDEDEEDEADDGDGDDGEGSVEWVTREVDATTVDLTELQGENATMLSRFDLPNGTYSQVRLHVAEVNGTLTTGEDVRVKLPSERLKLNERFTVGDGEEVDFVFDATVFEAGKSGKYILKPVASESGTDVPIREVDRDDGREGRLGARFLGPVRTGEAATVKITRDGEPVSGATVEIGDRSYETGSDGTVMFDVPADAEELEVEISAGEAEAELKRTFGGDGADERDDGSDDDSTEGEPGSQSNGGQGETQAGDGGAGDSAAS